jgi:hypothetical protein
MSTSNLFRYAEQKSAACSARVISTQYFPAVPLGYLFADRKPKPCARIIIRAVKPLKNKE